MAAPVVSGIASIIIAEKPDISISELTNILNKSSEDILIEGKDQQSGYGLPNAERAWQILIEEK